MGGEAPGGPAVLRVRLPRRASVRVLRDGAPLLEREAAELDLELGPGVHRVEARIGGRMWLISNQIHLR